MRIVIASDKFKGSATGSEVATALAAGIAEVLPHAEVEAVPVADGGEGTLQAAIEAGFERVTVRATGPTGEPVDAAIAMRAVVSMSISVGRPGTSAAVPGCCSCSSWCTPATKAS